MAAISSEATSRTLALLMASPRPMLTLILTILGTAMTFLYWKRFIMAGTASVL